MTVETTGYNNTLGWRGLGACRNEPIDIFFPEIELTFGWSPRRTSNKPLYEEALAVCKRCIVTEECLTDAISNKELYGVWGGKTPPERMELLAQSSSEYSRNRKEQPDNEDE